jgi:hypothetical protein
VFRNVSRGGSYYQAKKHIGEDLIFSELLPNNLFDVPDDMFYSENDDFMWETKIVLRGKKNTVKLKQASRKVALLQMC